jgi:hypothetical protein
LGLVWIDVEGHEAAVLAGAASLGTVPVVIEYQPRLHPASGRLHALIAERFDRIINLADGEDVSLDRLERARVTGATDLLLLARP